MGITVTMVEQASRFREVGAGLMMAPNASRVLRQLRLASALENRGQSLRAGWQFRRWQDGSVLFAQEYDSERRGVGEGSFVLHRAELVDLLRTRVPDRLVSFGRRCVQVLEDDTGVGVRLADGSVLRADLLIGADGVHSVVRGAVSPTAPATVSGLCAWRCLVPAQRVAPAIREPVQTIWLGPERNVVHYPISGGNLINVAAVTPVRGDDVESWSATGDVAELLTEFNGWDAALVALLGAAPNVGKWAVLEREPMPRIATRRIALLGDAAHPMFPFLAQGAAQALEDAAVLGTCLRDASAADVPDALRRYQDVRLPRTIEVQRRSREARAHHHLPDGPAQRSRDAEFATLDRTNHNSWLYDYDAVTAARPTLVAAQRQLCSPLGPDRHARTRSGKEVRWRNVRW
jgi:salicylate hydroxylase